jgi:hypothetical protein
MKTKTIGIIAMTALFIGCPDLMQAQHEEKSNANQRIEKNNLRENFRIKRDGNYDWFTKNKRNESGEEKRQFTRKLMTTRGVIKNLTNENRNSLTVAVAIGVIILPYGTGPDKFCSTIETKFRTHFYENPVRPADLNYSVESTFHRMPIL